ncbi:MAG: hypothetical protein M1368_01395 [Thaumarchaeota archaeon]|nr:hypothetical protein [Nitrososphaerota archaeon]
MSEAEQRTCKKQPLNIKRGFAYGLLTIEQTALAVNLGSVQFVRDGFLFRVDQEELLSIRLSDKRQLEISLHLYSKKDELLAFIENNQWKTGQNLPWDLQAGWRWLRLRHRKYKVALEIDARRMPVGIRGDLWRHGQHFEITGNSLKFNGVIKRFKMKDLCLVGMYLSADTKSGTFNLVPDERFGPKGVIVSEANPYERMQKGLAAWDDLVNKRPVPEKIYAARKVEGGLSSQAKTRLIHIEVVRAV